MIIDSGKVRAGSIQKEYLVEFSDFTDKKSKAQSMIRNASCGPIIQGGMEKSLYGEVWRHMKPELEDKCLSSSLLTLR